MKPFRYQIRVAGYTPSEYISLLEYDLRNHWLDLIGTTPELYMVDTIDERWLTSDEIYEITGLNKDIVEQICNLRMHINALYGEAQSNVRNVT